MKTKIFTLLAVLQALCIVSTFSQAPAVTMNLNYIQTLCSLSGTGGANPGSNPAAGLTLGTDGNFYGTTEGGGANYAGTVFKITTSGSFTSLCSLTGTGGASPGTEPTAPLVLGADGNFYGTTSQGGSHSAGTVFKVTTSGSLTSLHSFTFASSGDGAYPSGGLVLGTDGNFYGTAQYGGSKGRGTVFEMTTSGSVTKLCSFTGTKGAAPGSNPTAALVQGSDGYFYGTTTGGGVYDNGTAFKVATSGSLSTLYSFSYWYDGAHPSASLAPGADGNFYGTTASGGTYGQGTMFQLTTSGSLTRLCALTGTGGANPGTFPSAAMTQGADGNFYGTTQNGGSQGRGTVFKITTSGSLTSLGSFNYTNGASPNAVLQGSDGGFYGTTSAGGSYNQGTVFKLQSTSDITASSATFHADVNPQGQSTSAHFEYGTDTNYGTPTSVQVTGSGGSMVTLGATVATLQPGTTYHYRLVATNATGTTNGPDQVFTTPVLPSVVNDGSLTASALGGSSVNATLSATVNPNGSDTTVSYQYGTTPSLGSTSSIQVIGGSSATGVNGTLNNLTIGMTYYYKLVVTNQAGTVYGAVQSFTANPWPAITMDQVSTLASFNYYTTGERPNRLVQSWWDGNFYGTTQYGGSQGSGTVFTITMSGSFTKLADFNYSTTGDYPHSALLQTSYNTFYGTTSGGGASYGGTVFKITTSGSLTSLYSFGGTNGAYPVSALAEGYDGNLYGTTTSGGTSGNGTVFKMTLSGSLTSLYSFSGKDGIGPQGELVQRYDGNFYGTTASGGSKGVGSVFKITTSGSLTSLYSFTAKKNTQGPVAGLLQASDGNFYGTTLSGGANQMGTLFKMTPAGNMTTLCTFTGTNGQYPIATLVQNWDGDLYGTTQYGGTSGAGTAFKITTSGSLTTLYSFSYSNGNGYYPTVGLTQAWDGNFYGTTDSTVFKLIPVYVTASSATLVGTVNPETLNTTAYFRYGTDTSYGSPIGSHAIGNGTQAMSMTDTLYGLQPGTTYHYQIVATSTAGTFYGPDTTFTTLPAPVITTGIAETEGWTGANVAGSVNPLGVATSVYVIYSSDMGSWQTDPISIGNGTSAVNLNLLVNNNLTPNTTYHYQIVTTSAAGTFFGDDQTFTTGAFTLSEVVRKNDFVNDGITDPSVTFTALGQPAMNDNGFTAFQAKISTKTNNLGIWATDDSGMRLLVARAGDPAPGIAMSGSTSAVFAKLGDPVYNNNEAVAFIGKLVDGVGDAIKANDTGIWSTDGWWDSLHLVARVSGTQAVPGCPPGAMFAKFKQIALPNQGGVVFLAQLADGPGGVTSDNDLGIWAVDTTGTLQLIIREGDTLNVGDTNTTVKGLVFLPTAAGVSGQTRSFSQSSGDLLYMVMFKNGAQVIYKLALP